MASLMESCANNASISLHGNILMYEALKGGLTKEEARAKVSSQMQVNDILNAIGENFSDTSTLPYASAEDRLERDRNPVIPGVSVYRDYKKRVYNGTLEEDPTVPGWQTD